MTDLLVYYYLVLKAQLKQVVHLVELMMVAQELVVNWVSVELVVEAYMEVALAVDLVDSDNHLDSLYNHFVVELNF